MIFIKRSTAKASGNSKKAKQQPMHTSTPTPRRMQHTPVRTPTTSAAALSRLVSVEGVVESPQQVRRSPRKSKQQLFAPPQNKGVMPPAGSNLFQVGFRNSLRFFSYFVLLLKLNRHFVFKGCAFLLTHVKRSESNVDRERALLRHDDSTDVTDESVSEGLINFFLSATAIVEAK